MNHKARAQGRTRGQTSAETLVTLGLVAVVGLTAFRHLGTGASRAIADSASGTPTTQTPKRGALVTSQQAMMALLAGAAVLGVDGVIVSGTLGAATKVWRETALLDRMHTAVVAADDVLRGGGAMSVVREEGSRATVAFTAEAPRKVAKNFARAWRILEKRLSTPLEPEDAYRLLQSYRPEQIYRVSEAIWDPGHSEKWRMIGKSAVHRLHREKPITGRLAGDALTDESLVHNDRIQDGFRTLAMLPDDVFDHLAINPRFWEKASVGEIESAEHLWGARWNGRPTVRKDGEGAAPAWHDDRGLAVTELDERTHSMTYTYRRGVDPTRLPTPVRLTIDPSRRDVIERLRLTESGYWDERAPWKATLADDGSWVLDVPTTERLEEARAAYQTEAMKEFRETRRWVTDVDSKEAP